MEIRQSFSGIDVGFEGSCKNEGMMIKGGKSSTMYQEQQLSDVAMKLI